jgi:hypothetical protein
MIKLKLNWFGNLQANIDERAGGGTGASKDLVTITIGSNTYNIPETAYRNLPQNAIAGDDAEDSDDLINYTKYYITRNGNVSFSDFQTYLTENGLELQGDLFGNSGGSVDQTKYNNITKTLNNNFQEAQNLNTITVNGVTTNITNPSTGTGLTPTGSGGVNVDEAQLGAFNQYYQDVYSLAPGTGGAEMLNRLEQSYMNQAQQAATMADVGFQQAALQQAQTVKQITDQVRSERMARLRAGMSESQIANQDMQMLMANVNTLNQNAQMLNEQRLQAQIGMNTAQDQAYTDFLTQANQRGQVASAMAASDAGDAYQQTIRQMSTLYGNDPTKWTAQQWSAVSREVTGFNPNAK